MSKFNQKITLDVLGMHCASCASLIKRNLEKLDGVVSCVVNVGTEKAMVEFNTEKIKVSNMNAALQKFGYALVQKEAVMPMQATPLENSLHAGHDMGVMSSDLNAQARKLQELKTMEQHIRIILPFIVLSILEMIWEMGAHPLGFWSPMPMVVSDLFQHLLPIFATYTLFVIGTPYLQGVLRFVKFRSANMDTLVGMGTSVAYIYSFILSVFQTQLAPFINTQQTYYDVTIVVIGFITIGKYFEARSKQKTGEAIEKLIGLQAKTAIVLRAGKQIEIPVAEVVVGDIFIVKPGQKIPVDGEITEGNTSIDESMITGESIPVDKKVGELVIGATINKQGALQVRATKVGSDTMLAQIILMVEAAQGSKAPIEHLADQISAVFVPVILGLALVALTAWLIVGSQFMPFPQALSLGLVSFVGILVVACPCAMGLATPTAIIVGVGKAAQNGILIKNAESLQKLNSVNYVVLDKTGTVTKGQPEVTDIIAVGDTTPETILQLVASLEEYSEHPLARAVVQKSQSQKLQFSTVRDFRVLEGKGLVGVIAGQKYYAGNLKLVQDLKLKIDADTVNTLTLQGKTPVVFMTETKVLGYLAIADTVKADAKAAVTKLHQQGIKVAMLTGDHKQTAQYIAKLVGIDHVIAEVLPGDKASEILRLQAKGYRVAMVGDGINDAPALVRADVGIAMGTGTDVAIESAGMTLLGGHLAQLPKAVTLSRATMRTIKQNLFWAFFYNVIGIPVAAGLLYPVFGIMLNPGVAGAAMAFSSVSVVLNALRLKTVKLT